MRKLTNFVPPKPITEPFGPGTGQAHTFSVGRDGCLSIQENERGGVDIIAERGPGGRRSGFTFLPGGGYARLDEAEVEQPKPEKKKAEA